MVNKSSADVYVHPASDRMNTEALGVFAFSDQKKEWQSYCISKKRNPITEVTKIDNHFKKK